MTTYNLIAAGGPGWLPEAALRDGLIERFPGTRYGHNVVPGNSFPLYTEVPDPVPGDADRMLEAALIDTGDCLSFEDATLEKVTEITIWVLATFPVPPGADVTLWCDDDVLHIDPATVTAADMLTHFDE